jgi:hypothetical protein
MKRGSLGSQVETPAVRRSGYRNRCSVALALEGVDMTARPGRALGSKTFNLSWSDGIIGSDISHDSVSHAPATCVGHAGQEMQTPNPFSYARYHHDYPLAED